MEERFTMRSGRLPILIAGIVALLVLLVGCGGSDSETTGGEGTATAASDSSAGGGELSPVTTDYAPGSSQVAIKLGDEQGFFEKHGIEMKYAPPTANGAAGIAALISGELTVSSGALTAVQSAVAEGFDVKLISAFEQDYTDEGMPMYLTVAGADSGIKSFRDLEGKTVGVNSLKGSWEVTVEAAVKAAGGDPDRVDFVSIPLPDQQEALKQGRVDAVATLQPFGALMVAEGAKLVGDQQAEALGEPEAVSYVMYASKKFVDDEPEVAKAFVEALTEAADYANAHPEAIKKLQIDEGESDPEIINGSPPPRYTTTMPKATLENWRKLLLDYGAAKTVPTADEVLWSGAPTGGCGRCRRG